LLLVDRRMDRRRRVQAAAFAPNDPDRLVGQLPLQRLASFQGAIICFGGLANRFVDLDAVAPVLWRQARHGVMNVGGDGQQP